VHKRPKHSANFDENLLVSKFNVAWLKSQQRCTTEKKYTYVCKVRDLERESEIYSHPISEFTCSAMTCCQPSIFTVPYCPQHLLEIQGLAIKPTTIREEGESGTKHFMGLFAAGEHEKDQQPLFRRGSAIGFYIAEPVVEIGEESYYTETLTHDRYGHAMLNSRLEPRRSNCHMGLADGRQLDGAAVRSAVAFANSLWADLDDWYATAVACDDNRARKKMKELGWLLDKVGKYEFWSPTAKNVKNQIKSSRLPPQEAVCNAMFFDPLPGEFPAFIAITDIYRGDEIFYRYDLSSEDDYSTQDSKGHSLYQLWHSKNTDIYYHPS
jgi:hypothetical protein